MNPTCPRCGGKHGVEVTGDGYEHDCAACGQRLICAIGLEGEMYSWHREDGSCGCDREPHTCDMDDEERAELKREHEETSMAGDPTRERDPNERKTLEDALHIATTIVDGDGPADEKYTLAAGFLVLCGDMAAMLDASKAATQYCGWCQRANADSRIGLATYTLDEVREHTVQCEHNPLVAEVVRLRAALSEACLAWELHLPSNGVAYDGDRNRIDELRRLVP